MTFAHRATRTAAAARPGARPAIRTLPGAAPMVADTTACALCHVKDLAETRDRQPDCRSCHAHPRHSPVTSQGVPISHALLDDEQRALHALPLPGLGRGRRPRWASARGATATPRWPRSGRRTTLHAAHRSYGCAACHAPVRHRVVAMSTSVDLACRDCHARGHRRPLPADTSRTATCGDCHGTCTPRSSGSSSACSRASRSGRARCSWAASPAGRATSRPDAPAPSAGRPLVSNEAACTGCHGVQWSGMLARWRRGYERRSAWVGGYLAAAARTFADSTRSAGARAQVRQAQALLAFLQARRAAAQSARERPHHAPRARPRQPGVPHRGADRAPRSRSSGRRCRPGPACRATTASRKCRRTATPPPDVR